MTRANIVGEISAHRPACIAGVANGRGLSGRAIRIGSIVGCGVAWGVMLCWIL